MKPAIIIAAATFALAPVLTSSAEARGLRIGSGFGIGVAAGIGMMGAMHHHNRSHSRGEAVVHGRYRCCAERHVERYERPSKPAPRVHREEQSEKEEKQEKKVIRKKPVKSEETAVAAVRSRPAKPAQEKVVAKLPKKLEAPAAAPAPGVAVAALPPPAAPVTQDLVQQSEPMKPFALATVAPQPVDTERLPRVQTVQQQPAGDAAGDDLNCRKFIPTLGQAIAVSCME